MKRVASTPIVQPHAPTSAARLIAGALILLSAAALIGWIVYQALTSAGQAQASRPVSTFAASDGCAAQPRFIDPMLERAHSDGLVSAEVDVHVSTSEPTTKGLVLVVSDLQARKQLLYRDQSSTWDDAGYLGPFLNDEAGYIYTAPVPRVSLADNPPEHATTIWRVDTDSQAMAPWVTLPAGAAPSTRNPFGLLGLAYDCTAKKLYASSVAGSSPREELGQVVRIDPETREIAPVISDVDALSLAVLRGGGRSWLYVGSAREGIIRAYELGADGAVVGEPHEVLSLRMDGAGADDRIRRIVLDGGDLFAFVSPFTFALRATGEREETIYRYTWNSDTQTWIFAEKRDRMR
jgi:hypothetical protein